MYAEFTDDLVTGNEMIDTQHKELICKINDLLKSCEERSNQSGAARMSGRLPYHPSPSINSSTPYSPAGLWEPYSLSVSAVGIC